LRKLTEDFTREIEIPLHRGSEAARIQVAGNMTQTLALWRDSRLPEAQFAALMQEARRRTQQAKGKHRAPGLVRPMAYFYTVLADLIAHSPDDTATPQLPASGPSRLLPNAATTARQAPAAASPAFQFTRLRSTPPVPAVPNASPSASSDAATRAYSPYIAGVILDYARELGTDYAGPTHVATALQLWQTSGLDDTSFVVMLQRARRQVTGNGSVNAMPQFFAAVEALLAQMIHPDRGKDDITAF
jgi:hypothetical protein